MSVLYSGCAMLLWNVVTVSVQHVESVAVAAIAPLVLLVATTPTRHLLPVPPCVYPVAVVHSASATDD